MLAAVLTRVSESGSAKTTRSYCLSVVAQERPAVVDDPRHPRVVVGVIGVMLDADALDGGVDLDRIHVLGAAIERDGHVRAAAGADDEHVVVRATREPLVDLVVERFLRLDRPDGGPGAGCR